MSLMVAQFAEAPPTNLRCSAPRGHEAARDGGAEHGRFAGRDEDQASSLRLGLDFGGNCTNIASVATELVASPTAVALRRIAQRCSVPLRLAGGGRRHIGNADVATLENARSALKKGMHNKAFEKFRELYRADPVAAWAHAEVQEGLCVCSAKLKRKGGGVGVRERVDLFAAEQRACRSRSRSRSARRG